MIKLIELFLLLFASGSAILLIRGGIFSVPRFLFLAAVISIAFDTYAGLVLLALGRFTTDWIVVLSVLLLAVGFATSVWRKSFPLRFECSRRDYILLLLIVVAAILLLPPSEFLIENMDGAIYLCTGVNLARTGTWSIPDSLQAEIPPKLRPILFEPFMTVRENTPIPLGYQSRFPGGFVLAGESTIQPMFLPVYPIWVGIFYSLLGLNGVFYVSSLFALLGICSIYFLAEAMELRRWTGILGALLLATSFGQLWFGRFPAAEMPAQVFALGALISWIYAFRTKEFFHVTFAVLLSGLLTFTKFEFGAVGVPVVLLLLIVWYLSQPGRSVAYSFVGLVYVAIVVGALAFLNNFSSSYYALVRVGVGVKLVVLGWVCLLLIGVMLSLPLLGRLRIARAILDKLAQSQVQQKIAIVVVLVFFLVALYGYFVRPAIPLPGDLDMVPRRDQVVNLGNQFNMHRIAGLVSPLGLVLALAGVMGWILRIRTPHMVVAFFFLPSFLYFTNNISAWPVYPWLLRRFVPVVFPILYLSVAYALVQPRDLLGCFSSLVPSTKRLWGRLLQPLRESRSGQAWASLFRSPRFRSPRVTALGAYFSFLWTPLAATLLLWAFFVYFYVVPLQAFSLPLMRETPMRGVLSQVTALAKQLPDESIVIVDEELKGKHLADVLSIIYSKRVLVIADNAATSAAHPATTEFLKQQYERGHNIFFLTFRGRVQFEKGQFYPERIFKVHLEYPYLRTEIGDKKTLSKVSVRPARMQLTAFEMVPKEHRESKDVTVTMGWSEYGYLSGGFFKLGFKRGLGPFRAVAPTGAIELPKEAPFPILRIAAKTAMPPGRNDPGTRTFLVCFVNGNYWGAQEILATPTVVSFLASSNNPDEFQSNLGDRLLDFSQPKLVSLGGARISVDRIEWVAVRVSPALGVSSLSDQNLQSLSVILEPGNVRIAWVQVQRESVQLPFRIDVGSDGAMGFIDRQGQRLFYETERHEDATFRWFQPGASIDLSLLRPVLAADAHYRIRIQLPNVAPEWVLQAIQIYLGDSVLIPQVTPGLNQAVVSGEELLRNPRLVLHAPAWRPYDYYGGKDRRLLGMAVGWIEIEPVKSK